MENIQTRFLDMKLFKFSVAALLALATAFLGGCSDDDGIDNRDRDYGYVQFKLHKEASYDAVSRAQNTRPTQPAKQAIWQVQENYLQRTEYADNMQVALWICGDDAQHFANHLVCCK